MDLNQLRGLNTDRREALPSASTYVTETDVDWSLKHFFVLLILGAGTAIFSSYLLAGFNAAPALGTLVAAAVGLCTLLIIFVFQSLLLKSFQLFLWVTLAESAGLLVFLYHAFTPWAIFGILMFAGYVITGFMRGRLDLTDHLRVHFGRFSRLIMQGAIGGLAIFFAFFYVGVYRNSGVSFETFHFVTAGSAPVLSRFVPEYKPDMSVNLFFEEFARAQLINNPQFVLLTRADQEAVVAQTGFTLRNQIAQATKTPVAPQETFEQYFYRVSTSYLDTMNAQGLSLLPIMLMLLIIYFVIRGVMFFLKWPVILVSYLIYRLLFAIKVVYITTEPRSKEIIMTR
jgi:hypothetical protein